MPATDDADLLVLTKIQGDKTIPTQDEILKRLSTVNDPELHRDLVSLEMIKDIVIKGGDVSFTVELTTPACPMKEKIEKDVRAALDGLSGMTNLSIKMTGKVRSAAPQGELQNVKHVVAIGSGKGGVGKSTVSVNTAIALARDGAKVGIMDADVYGPNVPTMLDVHEPRDVVNNRIFPAEKFGLKIISMGFFLKPGEPVIWRGPMLHSAVRQFLYQVEWGDLDYLVIDLPPGTGDIVLSLAQAVPLAGAVIVATPQAVALEDAAKAVGMFEKVEVPVLGIVENMSYLCCPNCDKEIDLFGKGGVKRAADLWGKRFLGSVPFHPEVRMGGDEGHPVGMEDNPISEAFRSVARNIAGEISTRLLSRPREISLDNLVLSH